MFQMLEERRSAMAALRVRVRVRVRMGVGMRVGVVVARPVGIVGVVVFHHDHLEYNKNLFVFLGLNEDDIRQL